MVSEDDCGGFELFGDHVFCLNAFKRKDVLALSYGIEERDRWSEIMSNRFGFLTKLYDCFIDPARSPPISGKARNGTGPGSCEGSGEICYETRYESYRICFGPQKETVEGRKYETMMEHLEGRGPLSTHLKIDVEGSEWTTLERLVESGPEEIGKIRTLDMEVHFGWGPDKLQHKRPERERLEAQVHTFVRLSELFYVTGSTLEQYNQGWRPLSSCPNQDCAEPLLHAAGGFSLTQFAISFVHPAMLGLSQPPPLGRGAAHNPAPAPVPPPVPVHVPAPVPVLPAVNPLPRLDPVPAETEEIERPCQCVYHDKSGRPGRPCMPPLDFYPFNANTPWRMALGKRIFHAVTGHLTEEDCDGFQLFGDSVWCNRAMKGTNVLGLSYGIEERDMWSEKMSNVFHMPTKLFDCFIPPRLSPPISGSAPNATGEGGCAGNGRHCYEWPYESYRICLGPEVKQINGRRYETLHSHLEGRGTLSTHVKIDTEGAEWKVLEDLLASPDDQQKIRTLEMEVHFSFRSDSTPAEFRYMPDEQRFDREVRIMEGLLDNFAVTGSTIEVYREDSHPVEECAGSRCPEPAVHIRTFQLDQFAVSFVNRALLGPEARGRGMRAQATLAVANAQVTPGAASPSCTYSCEQHCSSKARPGKPCLPPAALFPYRSNEAWRSKLGERVVAALSADISTEECGGFEHSGDHIFCSKAMHLQDAVALSYGIGERDLWSEKLGNVWRVPSRLYDCAAAGSPLMTGGIPSASGIGSCKGAAQCYEMPYQPFQVCLGPENARVGGFAYERLADHLRSRGALSTYVKIDARGSLWAILERLLDSSEDQEKIRTLDLRVRFDASEDSNELEAGVKVLERLQEHFRVIGSTLEQQRQAWIPEVDCPKRKCAEPALHTVGGFPVLQFHVSYVNVRLL